MDPNDFLAEFWQKKPCLIRGAVELTDSVLKPDELAGLACEEFIESRIIAGTLKNMDWSLRSGPFSNEDFVAMPDENWTLLVQDVDKFIPRVADLLDLVSFIPRWRIDDIMISYAARGGSVGPHVDNYDVFLIQASGRRRWSISSPIEVEELVEGCPVRILSKFAASEEWDLKAGDMLYLPPRVPHHGVSLDADCVTYSVGARSPSYPEIGRAYGVLSLDESKEYFRDRAIEIPQHPCAVSKNVVQTFADILEVKASQDFLEGLGAFLSEQKFQLANEALPFSHVDEFAAAWKEHGFIRLDENSRLVVIESEMQMVFANGVFFGALTNRAAIEKLCARRDVLYEQLETHLEGEFLDLVFRLYAAGVFYF